MPVIVTRHLFENLPNRGEVASEVVCGVFPSATKEAIAYELVRQGLLVNDSMNSPFDFWQTASDLQQKLQRLWDGPDVAVYILPIRKDAVKNGVAYRDGIFLFVSEALTKQAFEALFTHEYCHSCHRPFLHEPPTLTDSLLTEGLAEHAVASVYGKKALNPWTERYSHDEVVHYWHTYCKPKIQETGLYNHRTILMGGDGLPLWLGYCLGYRIVQAFLVKQGPHTVKELLRMNTEKIVAQAGFN